VGRQAVQCRPWFKRALGNYIAIAKVRMPHRSEIIGVVCGCPSCEVVENSKLGLQVICLVEVLLVYNTYHPSIAF
jgi:hypothetical protein